MASHPSILARNIVQAIHAHKIDVSTENAAHAAIFAALIAAGLPARSEVILSSRDRIDLMVETVGVEVKVKGSKRDIFRQLERYAEHQKIKALVLATNTAFPPIAPIKGTVPVFIASLSRGWL